MTSEKSSEQNAPRLQVQNVTKRFGGLTAVDNVSMEVYPAEVVGLVGDNGAGKSTLIKMISGVYPPDEGQMLFENKLMQVASPKYARELGIETIYQDLALAENMNVPDNIFLGREPTRRHLAVQFVDRKTMTERSGSVLSRLDILIPSLKQKIANLSGGQRQAVAIARAVYWDARLMIMDEPTAALGVAEQRKVYEIVRTLRGQGVSVIIISHNLADVFAVSDRIVVMRRGRKVGDLLTRNTNAEEIVGLMVGVEETKADYAAS